MSRSRDLTEEDDMYDDEAYIDPEILNREGGDGMVFDINSSQGGGADDGGDDVAVDTEEEQRLKEQQDINAQLNAEAADDGDDGEEPALTEEQQQMQDDLQKKLQEMQENNDSKEAFFEHTDSVLSVHINPANFNQCVSGSVDDTACLWDVSKGELIHQFKDHTDSVTCVQFSYNGAYIATGGMDGNIYIYKNDSSTPSKVQTLEGPSEVEWMDWHSKGHVIVCGSNDNMVWMWNAVNGKCMQVFSGHVGPVTCGGFTHDGKMIVSAGEDGSLIVWGPRAGKLRHKFEGELFHGEVPITCMGIHSSQNLIATGGADGDLLVVSTESNKIVNRFKEAHGESIECVAFSNVMSYVATGSMDSKLKVWDLKTGTKRVECKHDDGITVLRWHSTKPYVIGGGVDSRLKMWDARTGELLKSWGGHIDTILCMSICFKNYGGSDNAASSSSSSEGGVLISGSDDKSCLVFEI